MCGDQRWPLLTTWVVLILVPTSMFKFVMIKPNIIRLKLLLGKMVWAGLVWVSFLPPEKIFSGRYCSALFFVFFMFASTLSLERLGRSQFSHKVEGWTGSNPIENGRHRLSRLAAILEKLCFHTIMTVQVLLTVLV